MLISGDEQSTAEAKQQKGYYGVGQTKGVGF